MDVTGITAARAQEIADSSIVSAYVNGSKQLVVVNGAGAESVAGSVEASDWTDWNPNWRNSTNAAITPGNGVLASKYAQMGETIHFMAQAHAGSTSGGQVSFITLPVPLADGFRPSFLGHYAQIDPSDGSIESHASVLWYAISSTVLRMYQIHTDQVISYNLPGGLPFSDGFQYFVQGTYRTT